MKRKINKAGDKCRHCNTLVRKKICEFNLKKLEKPYFYTAYYYCKNCKTIYMHDKFKITN